MANLPEFLANSMNNVIVVLLIVLAMDYFTEATLSLINKEFRISIYLLNIIKKAFYLFIVMLAFIIDYIILSFGNTVDLGLNITGTMGMAVTLYIIGHEGLTILDNLIGIGLPVPEFLLKAFHYIKDNSGKVRKSNNF